MTTPTPDEARAVATEAFVFGFPLVLMDASRRVLTRRARAGGRPLGVNRLDHVRQFPDASFTDVVSPNADTLYSMAWLDLSEGAVVLDVPDSGGRYHLLPMLSAWTDVFASPGTRTTGGRGATYAIVGPGGAGGELRPGMRELHAPTSLVWLVGRTRADGQEDYEAVHGFQDGLRLSPLLAEPGGDGPGGDTPAADPSDEPEVDLATPPLDQVAAMGGAAFFGRLAELMVANPPAPADAPALDRFARIGLRPGSFAPGPALAQAVDDGARAAYEGLRGFVSRPGELVGGWALHRGLGTYGTDYAKRAAVALAGLGANLDEDAVYPRATTDGAGRPLTGDHRYRLHFDPGRLPPARAFWSLTMYDDRQAFVDNPLGRYAVGDRDRLAFGPDGSLDLFLQREAPGDEVVTNWLPAPGGSFNVILRIYWPASELLSGAWVPPPIERVS